MKNNYVKIRYANHEFPFVEEFKAEFEKWHSHETRLRTCTASTGYTDNYYYLRSYNTIVCIIDKKTKKAYDILRTEYGYTATSAEHIAKFLHDFDFSVDMTFRTNTDRYGEYYQRIR